ncbi:GGDEF domain-containing protein [Cellulomonas hominis]
MRHTIGPGRHTGPPLIYATSTHLAQALLVVAALCVGGGFLPLDPSTPVERWFAAAALLVGLAVLLLRAGERSWLMPTSLVVALLTGGVLIASCVTAEGVVIVSLGPILAAQFAVYAFDRRISRWILPLALLVLTVGMLLAPAPGSVITWLVLTVMTVLSTVLLGTVTQALRWYATTDDLTGALSRGAFLNRVAAELRDARRTGAPVTLVSVDVDDFKVINDTHGHIVGDEVLAGLVLRWREAGGSRDVIGRVGGDEFVLLLPGRDRDDADAWVGHLRALSTTSWSAGSAQALEDDDTASLVGRADAALYVAKSRRRSSGGGSVGRVTGWRGPVAPGAGAAGPGAAGPSLAG